MNLYFKMLFKQDVENYFIRLVLIMHNLIKYSLSLVITLIFICTTKATELPEFSSLVDIGDRQLHIRTMGHKSKQPTIILLSGPNQHWHSDSAWFALLQPLLAQKYHVLSVDRAGNAWSTISTSSSYQLFAQDLKTLLLKLKLGDVIFVNFASSNITSVLLRESLDELQVNGMLWIDPDILLPHSISLYAGYPASWYQKNINKILPYIADHNWTEKTAKRNTDQVITIETLIPTQYHSLMDWPYFKAVQQQRLTINNQQTVAREIANYYQDLSLAEKHNIPLAIPISIINTDFELHGVTTESENYQAVIKWQQEGDQWSEAITKNSHGEYFPVHNGDHLIMFQQPDMVVNVIEQLINKVTE